MESGHRKGPRYQVGDEVFWQASVVTRSPLPAERYTVVAVLPPDSTGTQQYRLRPASAGPERIATELELRH
jgi:hypothetical protein